MSQTTVIKIARNSTFFAVIFICAALVFVRDFIKAQFNAPNYSELLELKLDTAELHTQIIQHAKQADAGLTYYRDAAAHAAVVIFYNGITGTPEITDAILDSAEKYDIPLSLAFSLAYVESGYRPKAINKNRNASIDRGLFQLNNKTFTKLTEKDFFNPRTNAEYGLSHLRFCIDTAGNEIAALAMYNAGTTRVRSGGTPQVTLNYVASIQTYRAGLDELFKNRIEFIAAAQHQQQSAKKQTEELPHS